MERSVPEPPRALERPLQIIVVLLVLVLAVVLWPVLAAIVIGGFFAIVAYRPFEWLVRRLHGRRKLATWIGTAAVVFAIFVPVGLLAYLAILEAGQGVGWLASRMRNVGGIAGLSTHLPRPMRHLVPNIAEKVSAVLGAAAPRVASLAPHVLASAGKFLGEAFLAIVVIYYSFLEGPRFLQFLRRVSPLRPEHMEAFISEFGDVARGLFVGNVVTAAFHGVAAGFGYWIFGVPQVLFLGALTAIASFVPVIGTAIVWIPVVIGLMASGHVAAGVGLLIFCIVVVGGVDNILRPLVSKGHMALPNVLVFLTIFGGLQMFGLVGLLLGPLLGSLAVVALRLVARIRTGQRIHTSPPAPAAP